MRTYFTAQTKKPWTFHGSKISGRNKAMGNQPMAFFANSVQYNQILHIKKAGQKFITAVN